jgi:hypothetical protein
MSEKTTLESEQLEAPEITIEDMQPCKWLATHNSDYARAYNMVHRNGSDPFDLGILKLLSEGRIEIVPGILGETKYVSVMSS